MPMAFLGQRCCFRGVAESRCNSAAVLAFGSEYLLVHWCLASLSGASVEI